MFRQKPPLVTYHEYVSAYVICNLIGRNAIRGFLYEQSGPLLVFKNADYLLESPHGVQSQKIDGDAVLHENRVDYFQVIQQTISIDNEG